MSHSDSVSKEVEDEQGVTMLDVLEEERQLEEDAKAVLGQCDDDHCTYDQGYVKRQALYACLSCTPRDSPVVAGVCLACCYKCHVDHDLVELYTKRDFRCDCGNAKLPNNKCTLNSKKDEYNGNNKYNQNFKGVYCTCARPYPDPDDDVADEMIQCVVCEDWFHTRHLQLNSSAPSMTEYAEMICFQCCHKYPILQFYALNNEDEEDQKAVNKGADKGDEESVKQDRKKHGEGSVSKDNGDHKEEKVNKVVNVGGKGDDETGIGKIKDALLPKTCPLKTDRKRWGPVSNVESDGIKIGRTLFMGSDWRLGLCDCEECRRLLSEVQFLRCPEDTVHHYEEKNKGNEGDQYEEGMQALSSMERTQQVEAIQSYNAMKTELMDYLKKFAENNKVVREEDIQEFFDSMKSRKRRRIDLTTSL